MARLVTLIENTHAVSSAQIAIARGQRDRAFDLAVGLSFVPLYCFGATIVSFGLRRRFSSDQRHVRLAVTGMTSVVVCLCGLQLGQLWSSMWEAVRVGNGHMSSFRAASANHWSQQHVGTLFVSGILLFWVVAFVSDRGVSDGARTSPDPGAPGGILLH